MSFMLAYAQSFEILQQSLISQKYYSESEVNRIIWKLGSREQHQQKTTIQDDTNKVNECFNIKNNDRFTVKDFS
jgi:hypothetical protein